MPVSFGERMTRHMARHSHPFVLHSDAIESDRKISVPDTFLGRLLVGLSRHGQAFRQHRHRRAALVMRMDKAKLHMYDLGGKNLAGFWMRRAHLDRAFLSESDLTGASLFRANLEGADLTEAILVRVDFREANLGAARLFRSDLRGALLEKANLRHADLRGARMSATDVRGADLRDALLSDDFDLNDVVSNAATQWPDGHRHNDRGSDDAMGSDSVRP